jgi:uncharacterized protein YodC (DUF2158 family)
MNWKIGDVVELKSGMTVTLAPTGENKMCSTAWFSDGKKESAVFPAESLKLQSPPY